MAKIKDIVVSTCLGLAIDGYKTEDMPDRRIESRIAKYALHLTSIGRDEERLESFADESGIEVGDFSGEYAQIYYAGMKGFIENYKKIVASYSRSIAYQWSIDAAARRMIEMRFPSTRSRNEY